MRPAQRPLHDWRLGTGRCAPFDAGPWPSGTGDTSTRAFGMSLSVSRHAPGQREGSGTQPLHRHHRHFRHAPNADLSARLGRWISHGRETRLRDRHLRAGQRMTDASWSSDSSGEYSRSTRRFAEVPLNPPRSEHLAVDLAVVKRFSPLGRRFERRALRTAGGLLLSWCPLREPAP